MSLAFGRSKMKIISRMVSPDTDKVLVYPMALISRIHIDMDTDQLVVGFNGAGWDQLKHDILLKEAVYARPESLAGLIVWKHPIRKLNILCFTPGFNVVSQFGVKF